MKKLFLILVGTVLLAGTAAAQTYQKHIFGVRAGLNIANVSFDGVKYESKAGFHLGGSYQYLLTERMPLYLETGLQITQKGTKHDASLKKHTAFYVEIPVTVTYKFRVADEVALLPAAGFYYGIGLGGKSQSVIYDAYEDEEVVVKYDTFGSGGAFKRSDFGMRFGGSVEWRSYSFGLGYEFSLMNVAKHGSETHNRNFFISVGYNF